MLTKLTATAKSQLKRGNVRNLGALTLGSSVSMIVGLIFLPILTRLYSPSDFAVLAVFSSAVMNIGAAMTLRYEIAIPLADRSAAGRRQAQIAGQLATSISVIIAFILTAMWAVSYSWFGDFLGLGELGFWVPISACLVASTGTVGNWLIREGAYAKQGLLVSARTSLTAASQIAMSPLHWGGLGLVVGYTLGPLVGLTTMRHFLWPFGSLKEFRAVAAAHKDLPFFSAPATFIASFGATFQIYILALYYSPETTGAFSVILRVMFVPLALVFNNLDSVLFGSSTAHDTPAIAVSQKILRLLPKLVIWSVAIVVPSALIATVLIPIVLGPQWQLAAQFLLPLVPLIVARMIAAPTMSAFAVWDRQRELLLWTLLSIAVPFAVGLMFARNGATAPMTILATSAVGAVALLSQVVRARAIAHNTLREESEPST